MVNKKSPNAFPSPRLLRSSLLLLTATFLFSSLAPFSAAQEEQIEYRQIWVQWYFYPGDSVGECYANCVGSCLSECNAVAASIQAEINNCGSTCPARCADETCRNLFNAAPRAEDGLPVPQTPEDWSPYVPYALPGAPEEQETAGETQQNYAPCYPGQSYCVTGPGTVSEYDPSEAVYPTLPEIPCTPANYCYPGKEGVYEGTPEPEPVCPETAPDGHPMRWYDYLGCQDIYWKEHYCSQGGTCDRCTGRAGCIWNGAACVPCNAPSCSYRCLRPGGTAGGAQQEVAAPEPVIVQQREIPAPTPQPPTAVEAPREETPMPTTPVSPTTTAQATVVATPLPTPPLQCSSYNTCKKCANAPRADGKSQCGWSEFVSTCLGNDEWDVVNASGLKAGWTDDERDCPKEDKEKRTYCFKYKDCLSCAGDAGVKRVCQWSVKENACNPYNPSSEFKTNSTSEADSIILPNLCPERDCTQYSSCRACQENAACIWNFDDKKCDDFKGHNEGEKLYLFPNNCRGSAETTPTPTPVQCPQDCDCDSHSRVIKCGEEAVNDSGFLQVDRATANAGAVASIEHVDEITFSQPALGGDVEFVVKGHRSGTLLFIIPVTVGVTATVDAKTGEVKNVEQPWWSFLAG